MAERKDTNKRIWHLLPVEAVESVIEVLEFGAKKYSENNWRTAPYLTRTQITNSLKRHQAEIDKGDLYDKESSLFHAAHVACNALFQLQYELKGHFNQPTGITNIVASSTVAPQVTVITPTSFSKQQIELVDLVGCHTLTGWGRNLLDSEDGNDFTLVLDGIAYTFVEDPEDGYRSCLDKIVVNAVKVTCLFDGLEVQTFVDGETLVLVHKGKEIVRVGTRDEDGYYPVFVSEITNLPVSC